MERIMEVGRRPFNLGEFELHISDGAVLGEPGPAGYVAARWLGDTGHTPGVVTFPEQAACKVDRETAIRSLGAESGC